ncbi:MAG: hypothetical protein HYV59_14305 [Planctomycetes bacterium]|nr:hypothetical protein [Planctomycetota bacterium]
MNQNEKYHILVVSNEPPVLESVVLLLERLDYNVVATEHPKEAVENAPSFEEMYSMRKD